MQLNPMPPPSPRELQVWRVKLDQLPAALNDLAACLSAEERRRAERFVRQADRQRFTASHAALRMILGRYFDVPPEAVEIAIRAGGKPELASQRHSLTLRFNLSHSKDMALVALMQDGEVGVDVEYMRPMHDAEGIIMRYFSPGEQSTWHAQPEQERMAAFFRCWTRKEAYLKARGVGLSGGLDRFEVSLAPGEPARLVRDHDRPEAEVQWQLFDVSPGEGYMAACAAERGIKTVTVFDWLGNSPLPLGEGPGVRA